MLIPIPWIPFLLAAVSLNLPPRSDMAFVAANAAGNATLGIFAVLGILAGCQGQIFVAMIGLTTIVALSTVLFTWLKLLGAFYLLWFAYTLSKSVRPSDADQLMQNSNWQAFRHGMLTNGLDPKVGVFYLSFLPQFISPAEGSVWLQFLALALPFSLLGALANLAVSIVASHSGAKLHYFRQVEVFFRYSAACMMAFFAVGMIFGE
ncbi:LysE family translocator [Erythrobacter ani]|nr:LysE family translocator [Erythrobacter ani]